MPLALRGCLAAFLSRTRRLLTCRTVPLHSQQSKNIRLSRRLRPPVPSYGAMAVHMAPSHHYIHCVSRTFCPAVVSMDIPESFRTYNQSRLSRRCTIHILDIGNKALDAEVYLHIWECRSPHLRQTLNMICLPAIARLIFLV